MYHIIISNLTIASRSGSSRNFLWNPQRLTSYKSKRPKASRIIKSKKQRISTWTHTYVCLAFTTQEILPDCDERAELLMAGLGEKKIQMSLDADAVDINSELCSHFPKLTNCGSFELLKLKEGGGTSC